MSFFLRESFRLSLGLAALVLLATCQTPPPVVEPTPEPVVTPPPKVIEIDDDHKLVSRQEFLDSAWVPLPGVTSWKQEGNSVALTLADGRVVAITFLTLRSVRLWFPQEAGALPFSPGERTWPTDRPEVVASEVGAVLTLKTTALTLVLNKETLAWEILTGTKSLFKSPVGPAAFKKRLKQDFSMATAALWSGLGSAGTGSASAAGDKTGQWLKLWASADDAEQNGPWAVPFLLGVGGNQPFGLLLDNSYQSYFRLEPAAPHLGTLNATWWVD